MFTKNIREMARRVLEHVKAGQVGQVLDFQRYYKHGKPIKVTNEEVGSFFKGSFVGCLTHASEGFDPKLSNAVLIVEEFGIPEKLVGVIEDIFNDLITPDAVLFFCDIPLAIGVDGKDLRGIAEKFYFSRCESAKNDAAFMIRLLKHAPIKVNGGIYGNFN